MARRTPSITRPLTRGLTRALSYRETGALSWGALGASAPVVQPIVYDAAASAFFTAAGITSAAEKIWINHFIQIAKLEGFWDRHAANPNVGYYPAISSEAASKVNLFHPGTNDLTKTGTPTFVANTGWSTGSTSNFLSSGIQPVNLSQNNCSIGGIPTTSTAGGTYDMGESSAGSGPKLSAFPVSGVQTGNVMGSGTAAGVSTSYNIGARMLSRRLSTQFVSYNDDVRASVVVNTSVASTSTNPVQFLVPNGIADYSRQNWAAFWLTDGWLSDAEAGAFICQANWLADGYRYGMPNWQPAGYGDATVTADMVVFTDTLAGFLGAIVAARAGSTVAIVTDYLIESPEQYGGMPANGLGFIDIVVNHSAVVALYRWIISQVNSLTGRTDNNDQTDLSIQPRWLNRLIRQLLVTYNIPVYHSSGLHSVTKVGGRTTGFVTNDGRVCTANVCVLGDDYDGVFVYLSGAPVTIGREPSGSGSEASNGFRSAQIGYPGDETTANDYYLDCNVTPGNTASGLLPNITAWPGLVDGVADPTGQMSNNFRLITASSPARRAALAGGTVDAQPAGYVTLDHELLGRYCDACAAGGHTARLEDIFTETRAVSSGVFDWNNAVGISSDMPGSGSAYAACGTNVAARLAEVKRLLAYDLGILWWIENSGDSRIPAAMKTSAAGYGLDAKHFMDYVSWKPRHAPGLPYRRNPIWIFNKASAKLNANDLFLADGTAPRISTNTVGVSCYPEDIHGGRGVQYDSGDGHGLVYHKQGSYSDSGTGGTDHMDPVPIECIIVDPGLITISAMSMTFLYNAVMRVEPTLAGVGQFAGVLINQARVLGTTVDLVPYATARTAALAEPDPVALLLPQVN